MSAAKLVRPDFDYKDSFLEAAREFQDEKRLQYLPLEKLKDDKAFKTYVEDLNKDKGDPFEELQDWAEPVAETILWFVKDEEFIGLLEIRHRLNWHLERWGGHLHFMIRPTKRGQGYGQRILKKALPCLPVFGIEQALLTIDPLNSYAINAIEAIGAKREEEKPATDQFPARIRFWIEAV